MVILIADMPIYREQEEVTAIYFLEQGQAAYVLPRYKNAPFVTIGESETFGIIDIVFRKIELDSMGEKERKAADSGNYKHKFTCHTRKNSVILQLSFADLKRMELEYKEVYDELFEEQAALLEQTLITKQTARNILEGIVEMDGDVASELSDKPKSTVKRKKIVTSKRKYSNKLAQGSVKFEVEAKNKKVSPPKTSQSPTRSLAESSMQLT